MYIPNTDKYDYPEDTSAHYAPVDEVKDIKFDKDYPYVDNSKFFAFKRFWIRLLLRILIFPWSRVKMGIKIYGKSNLKKHKLALKQGAITVSNHVHPWDYICTMKALHHIHWPYVLVWYKNINAGSGSLVRFVGGIPIPEGDEEAKKAFDEQVTNLIKNGSFLQFYAEGSMWEYYAPIRPFKFGAASYAVKNDKPILPMAYSYREPGWFRKKVLRQKVLFSLNIGQPVYRRPELEYRKQVQDLTIRVHQACCELAGFKDNNPYPPLYEHSKKVDLDISK